MCILGMVGMTLSAGLVILMALTKIVRCVSDGLPWVDVVGVVYKPSIKRSFVRDGTRTLCHHQSLCSAHNYPDMLV